MTGVVLLLGLVPSAAEPPAVAPSHRRVPGTRGLDAVVLDCGPSLAADGEAEAMALAVAQASVLSAYAAEHDVLPVALGAAFSDDRALAARVGALADRIAAERAALAGSAEYVVAVERSGPPPAVAEAPAAAGYLRRRQADRDARRTIEAERRAFLGRVVAALRETGAPVAAPRTPSGNALLTVSALIRRPSAGAAAAALGALAPEAARLGLGLRMVGPCAPFSFVTREPFHV
jgi:hypothetical protein